VKFILNLGFTFAPEFGAQISLFKDDFQRTFFRFYLY